MIWQWFMSRTTTEEQQEDNNKTTRQQTSKTTIRQQQDNSECMTKNPRKKWSISRFSCQEMSHIKLFFNLLVVLAEWIFYLGGDLLRTLCTPCNLAATEFVSFERQQRSLSVEVGGKNEKTDVPVSFPNTTHFSLLPRIQTHISNQIKSFIGSRNQKTVLNNLNAKNSEILVIWRQQDSNSGTTVGQ